MKKGIKNYLKEFADVNGKLFDEVTVSISLIESLESFFSETWAITFTSLEFWDWNNEFVVPMILVNKNIVSNKDNKTLSIATPSKNSFAVVKLNNLSHKSKWHLKEMV